MSRNFNATFGMVAALSLAGCANTSSFSEMTSGLFQKSDIAEVKPSKDSSALIEPALVDSDILGPVEGELLTLELEGLTDDDGVIDGFNYRWEVESQPGQWLPIKGGVTSSLMPTQALVGSRLRVVIYYVDGGGTEETIVSMPTGAVRNVNNPPEGLPVLNGLARQHETLYFDASSVSDEDGLGPLVFSWEASENQADWTEVSGASSNSLTLSQDLVGKLVRGVISYKDAFGVQEALYVGPSARIEEVNDPVEGVLSLIGSAEKGQILKADLSSISDPDGIVDRFVTWEVSLDGLNWQAIETNRSYDLDLEQRLVGHFVRARLTVTDGLGEISDVLSGWSEKVKNVNSAPRGVIRIIQ